MERRALREIRAAKLRSRQRISPKSILRPGLSTPMPETRPGSNLPKLRLRLRSVEVTLNPTPLLMTQTLPTVMIPEMTMMRMRVPPLKSMSTKRTTSLFSPRSMLILRLSRKRLTPPT